MDLNLFDRGLNHRMAQLDIKRMILFCGRMSAGLKLISVTHGGQLWVVFVYSPGGPRKTT